MIQKIYNPGASLTNSVVVINTTACCGSDCPDCAYVIDSILPGDLVDPATYTFLNSTGTSVSVVITSDNMEVIQNELLAFINSIGYYGTLDDIRVTGYINFEDELRYKIEVIGCAVFVSLEYPPATLTAEVLCNFTPVCDYYFESDGNGVDPVPVSKNGTGGTVTAFTMSDTAEDVMHLLEDFFTTSTVTVVKNTTAGYFEITVTGAPSDILYIDGVQGIKSNCRKIYIA